jgi:membrane-associated phospholipid phosphatase
MGFRNNSSVNDASQDAFSLFATPLSSEQRLILSNSHMRLRVLAVTLFLFVAPLPATHCLAQEVDSTGKRPAKTFDEKLFLSINHYGIRHSWLDQPMKGLSNSITFTSVGIPAALYLYGMSSGYHDEAVAGASMAISEAASGLISQGLKLLIQRERPYHVLQDVRLPGTPAGGYSMPSGHSTAAWALATSLALHYPKSAVVWPSIAYALGVSLSRPYLGVHYPTDLVAGAIVGAGTAYLVYHYETEIMSHLTWALPPTTGTTGQKVIFSPFMVPLGLSVTVPILEP